MKIQVSSVEVVIKADKIDATLGEEKTGTKELMVTDTE